jgi:hypothetical protein
MERVVTQDDDGSVLVPEGGGMMNMGNCCSRPQPNNLLMFVFGQATAGPDSA